MPAFQWEQKVDIAPRSYACGYCGDKVGPDRGFRGSYEPSGSGNKKYVYTFICSSCRQPTYFDHQGQQWPGVAYGAAVEGVPQDLEVIWGEARRAMSVAAPHVAVMGCRKILMHVAVGKGAKKNEGFQYYVKWLVNKHYMPPGSGVWLDRIRDAANDVNHEIDLIEPDTAERVMAFTQHLLRNVYEMPAQAGIAAESEDAEPARRRLRPLRGRVPSPEKRPRRDSSAFRLNPRFMSLGQGPIPAGHRRQSCVRKTTDDAGLALTPNSLEHRACVPCGHSPPGGVRQL